MALYLCLIAFDCEMYNLLFRCVISPLHVCVCVRVCARARACLI